ncbi:MAG TPA: methionine gamma-lyase family protein [Bacillales bacterium]|nr:methionine gamma-lyase family protein [Bacillales bacterium]
MKKKNFDQALRETEHKIAPIHREIERIAEINQKKVLDGFRRRKVSESHFHPSTGYGYDDAGRDTLEAVYADIFGAEEALVRPQIVSGTHAITTALFGVLRPGDELLFISGTPYDTLEEIIGLRGTASGSLREFQIDCRIVELNDEGGINLPAVNDAIHDNTKMVAIQRSRGYDQRPSITVAEIETAVRGIRERHPNIVVFVDNCYGEFVEPLEPTNVGVDLMAGSLIKNPGGGLAKTGGYLAGKAKLIERCACRLTAPGLGKETGATLAALPDMFQGFFLAPHVVAQALKGAVFTAALLEHCGFETSPKYNEPRTDLIQAVHFHDRKRMIAFCQAVQAASPVNAYVNPQPSPMPGYESEVIMAAGTFVQGSSIELSADGPLRQPYTAYVQGGLTYEHVKIAVTEAAKQMLFGM